MGGDKLNRGTCDNDDDDDDGWSCDAGGSG